MAGVNLSTVTSGPQDRPGLTTDHQVVLLAAERPAHHVHALILAAEVSKRHHNSPLQTLFRFLLLNP